MKIAILGGSFDPPHLGHILIARQAIEFAGMDQIWLMPNYNTVAHHAIFQKQLSPVEDRFAMVKLLEDEKIKASNFEIENNKKSITIITLKMLSEQYPEHTFYWITGSDKLETFYLYDDWRTIITKYHLIIFPREHILWHLEERVKESLQLQTIPKNVIVLHNKELVLTNASSTAIRERVHKNLPIDFIVTPTIEKYIKEHKLYV
ncbi:MAG TPA: nicotinate (nicotinamide) nucleotide adenylyltransferase [Candidatus Sulfotelmatobacter sp.]|jgi:nicotinate-nucleotide adenylyltransferase|nr:nicotinate (nicotinamide) nucleotide adenylyltransferase [Candidatus Sulfotelmatobacter sp.]